jgi:hypothetical protein
MLVQPVAGLKQQLSRIKSASPTQIQASQLTWVFEHIYCRLSDVLDVSNGEVKFRTEIQHLNCIGGRVPLSYISAKQRPMALNGILRGFVV